MKHFTCIALFFSSDRKRQWFSLADARAVLLLHKPALAAYIEPLLDQRAMSWSSKTLVFLTSRVDCFTCLSFPSPPLRTPFIHRRRTGSIIFFGLIFSCDLPSLSFPPPWNQNPKQGSQLKIGERPCERLPWSWVTRKHDHGHTIGDDGCTGCGK